jgi:arginyl-tRNA synthetase
MRKNNVSHQTSDVSHQTLNKEEHDLARLLFYFPEIIEDAGKHFAPNTLCSYLFNLAQAFNLLYAKHPILGNDLRLMLTEKTATTLKEGLRLLGIETVERM